MFKKKSSKILLGILIAFIVFVAAFLIIFPNIEIRKDNKLIICSYSDYLSEFDENLSYGEIYSYSEKRDISVKNCSFKKFLFFFVFEYDYVEGDFRKTQFVLKEEILKDWITNGKVIENPKNIDIKALIEGKKSIVGNTRYLGNDYDTSVTYKLGKDYQEFFVFYKDDLLIIQMGTSDELPKFIAYK